ncbi:N-acetylneuraminate synthase [Pontibacter sp. HSC-36F09]|uniref:N-acetylneuraminate synthase n=1 Tax=Pontibacter sp. HSC-36F09 TaxID=2910966 RepID=UPI0020A06FFE|nr:N-acetylneuraminate synthase [Pontibacter sp. HSC-36F09]MCP2043671.1 N-acetylneuraminate synthase/N,N'-diacetyllegionaminate synthase [Pontibacter sp. HSC-36F09]
MNKTIIIAEAGVNHNGDLALAKKLIDVAADAGVDYVKFQTFKADKLVSKSAKQAEYQKKNLGNNTEDSQYAMLKKLELSEDMHNELLAYSKQKGIKFLSTGFDEESVDYLESLGIDLFKIPSGEITNYPYLKHIAPKGKPIVVSTGMATLGEIEDALNVLKEGGASLDKITVLHCNTDYPTRYEDVNLNAMLTIQQAFKIEVGYSDHTLGIEVPIAAVALGASVIEKHFTLDRNLPGPDHKASLEPHELKEMVFAIRNIEKAMSGNGRKEPTESELLNKGVARKSIHLKQSVAAGELLNISNLEMKRPGDGISPMDLPKVIGRKLNSDMEAGNKLEWKHLL